VTECQGCGAWNERHRTLCVLCGTPLAEADEWDAADELPPLPPLPDGGLSITMPAWLRAAPADPEPDASPAIVLPVPDREEGASVTGSLAEPAGDEAELVLVADAGDLGLADDIPADQPLGPQADPRTFLRDDDFPRWIRELPELPPRPLVTLSVDARPEPEPDLPIALSGDPASSSPSHPEPSVEAQEAPQHDPEMLVGVAEPSHAPTASRPMTAAPPELPPPPRRREPWELPLLVVLVVGVIAAVIWTLWVNGLIGSTM
jgi:hypothetical protein